MRTILLAIWILLPIGAWAYHEGPGQDLVALDSADAKLAAAHEHALAGKWSLSVKAYEEALRALPKDRLAEARRARLELNKARMQDSKLPEAHADLRAMVEELQNDPTADPKVLAGARSAHANAQYYMTWLMRLEGLPREQWEPEVEAARQTYRLLAEEAVAGGDTEAAGRHRADLESAVRLARMELKDLQGLPLPSQ